MNMFEKAARKGLRFNYKGSCTVEDLWRLRVEELDIIYSSLKTKARRYEEESLLKKNKVDETLKLKIDIVKYIVEVKLSEKEVKKQALEKKERKSKILEVIAEKQDESLKSMSLEELTKLVEDL